MAPYPPQHERASSSRPQNRSLLSRQIQQHGSLPDQQPSSQSPEQRERESIPSHEPLLARSPSHMSGSPTRDIFTHASHLAAPFSASSYRSGGDGVYGSLTSRLSDAAREEAAQNFREQQRAGLQLPDKEREPLLLRRVEEADGTVGIEVIGQSTLHQTVLNSTNVLVGVGILSLPFGIRYAGWALGLPFLAVAAVTCVYTSRLLGRCMAVDRNIVTFADLAYIAFGRVGSGCIFMLELGIACVALFVLFADSLDLLVPGWGVLEFKIACGILMLPLSFVPLRLLGYTSSLGIICCIGIVVLVFVDGLIKAHAPGSLREPAATYWVPESWMALPLSFGLLMAPWGGLTVFPSIFRDMRHPYKWNRSLNITFGFTVRPLPFCFAAIGVGDAFRISG